MLKKKKNIDEYFYIQKDETVVKVGSECIWLWVAIEPKDKEILSVDISKERNMLVAERFLSHVIEKHGQHPVSTDGGMRYPHKACQFLKLNHHTHSFVYKNEKSVIERTMQYIKDRTEGFDDYFPCRKKKCKLKHVKQWLNLFIDLHNGEIIS